MIELAGGTGYKFGSASALPAPRIIPGISAAGPAALPAVREPLWPRGWSGLRSDRKRWARLSLLRLSAVSRACGPATAGVSRHGAMANSWTMDKIGPMARSRRLQTRLEAINGTDPQIDGEIVVEIHGTPKTGSDCV